MRIFLRLGSDIGRSDAVSNDRNKTSTPRAADDTAPILVPDGAGTTDLECLRNVRLGFNCGNIRVSELRSP